MRNEEFYIPVLECMVTSPLLDDTEKIRPRDRLALAQKTAPVPRHLISLIRWLPENKGLFTVFLPTTRFFSSTTPVAMPVRKPLPV